MTFLGTKNGFLILLIGISMLLTSCQIPEPDIRVQEPNGTVGKHLDGILKYDGDDIKFYPIDDEPGRYKVYTTWVPVTIETKSNENLARYGKAVVEKPVAETQKYITMEGLVPDKIYLDFLDKEGNKVPGIPQFSTHSLQGNTEHLSITFAGSVESEDTLKNAVFNNEIKAVHISVDESEYQKLLEYRKEIDKRYSKLLDRHEHYVDKFVENFETNGNLSYEWKKKMGEVNMKIDFYNENRVQEKHYDRWVKNSNRYIKTIEDYRSR